MKYVHIVDINGSFVEDAFVDELTEFTIETPVNDGFYKPKWDGSQWVEGLSQSEVDALKVVPIEQQISDLKAQLQSTDYKIIKCSECQLVGKDMPYDITELHAERQGIRDSINTLETSD